MRAGRRASGSSARVEKLSWLSSFDNFAKLAILCAMDPVRNPYSPGAGTPPPELAGRDELRERVRVALARIHGGRPSKSVLMVGLRGVGKTVLLDQFARDAEEAGLHALRIEAPEGRSLPAILAPELRKTLLRLSNLEKARDLARRALRAWQGSSEP